MEFNEASPFPLETWPPVTEEEFNTFHSGDRRLYSKLVIDLGRDTAESIQVMAFWIWLEKEGNDKNLINRMLPLPLALLNELADETVLCLKCVETERYPFGDGVEQISLLPEIVSSRINLRRFHRNRIGVLCGVSQVMNTVCCRAFSDIFWRPPQRANVFREVGELNSRNEGFRGNARMVPMFYNPFMDVPFGAQVTPPPQPLPTGRVGGSNHHHHPVGVPIHMLPREEGKVVPPDDRTIFLTFSKGYPITENEVRDFFSRRFGDFIEEIFMQEVAAGEQPLFARLVARSDSIINEIVDGSKAKYTINGKHVWARKYVKKQHQQPPRADHTRQQP